MPAERSLHVSISRQEVTLLRPGRPPLVFPVSTARAGTGMDPDSGKTPVGKFRIAEKIGADEPVGTIFSGRRPVGLWQPGIPSDRDLILTRILWLDGIDPENANTLGRFIYFHGTNHEDQIGTPASCGCIRMRNADILALFSLVETGDRVTIG